MSALPAPLTPADCDLRDFPRMMIDITRLRQSAFDAMINDGAWRAGLNLWFSAWHSVPAGSLPDDDAGLAKAAGLGRDLRTWSELKDEALHGFHLCSDGRLYHETVCEFVLEAWIEKLLQRISGGAGNAKRWKTEFDPRPLDAALQATSELLANLNPASKALAKALRKRPPSGADAAGSGSRPDTPKVAVGSQPDDSEIGSGSRPDHSSIAPGSRPDAKNVPLGSQETEKGQGYIEEVPDGTSSELADRQLPVLVQDRPDDVRLAFAAYDTMRRQLVSNARTITLDRKRATALRARLSEIGGLAGWEGVLAQIRGSPFLRGDDARGGRLVATIDWILNPTNLRKILEGNYDDTSTPARRPAAHSPGVRRSTVEALVEAGALAGFGGSPE